LPVRPLVIGVEGDRPGALVRPDLDALRLEQRQDALVVDACQRLEQLRVDIDRVVGREVGSMNRGSPTIMRKALESDAPA